ncbi:MAG TPA: N-acetylmuramoyl-L-alanine amidase [Thermoanaerobacterium sp.]|nr:N-acetylmuramoyl-L-alanine amidase [Thermoanaerobacterium sp.]
MKICIDPGHGGYDSGAVGNGLKEKDITLKIALKVRDLLKNSCDVILTRDSDNTSWNSGNDLATRCQIANNSGADYFISIHVNSGGGTGFGNYVADTASSSSINLGKIIHDNVAAFYKSKGFADRGLKAGHLWVLRRTNMPATLIENLFIDNPTDAGFLAQENNLNDIAFAIANAVCVAFNLPAPQKTVQSTQPVQTHWAQPSFDRLKQLGIVSDNHNLDSNVTWGEVSALLDKTLKILGR